MFEILNKNKQINELNEQVNNLTNEINEKRKQKSESVNEIERLNKTISDLQSSVKCLEEKERTQKEKTNAQIEKLKVIEEFIIDSQLSAIDLMTGIDFENYMGKTLEKLGYSVIVTKATGDSGADIIAEFDNKKLAIQCKRYSGSVGFDAIKEAHTAKDIYKCDLGVVLTNSTDFTKEAIENAKKLNIELWDRNIIIKMVSEVFDIDIEKLGTGGYLREESISSNIQNEEACWMDEEEEDPLLKEAIEMVIETQQASTSLVQRKFRIGYARAGRIIDQMEERGIISGYQGSKPRQVLVSKN